MEGIDETLLNRLFSAFCAEGRLIESHRLTNGHIHDSYYIKSDTGQEYLMQRINREVFPDVAALMENILLVTEYLVARKELGNSYFKASLRLVPTQPGVWHEVCKKGCPWRMYDYIPGTRTYATVPSPAVAEEGGKALGAFMMELAGLPAGKLHPTIPRFHDLELRYDQFRKAIEDNIAGRCSGTDGEIRFLQERAGHMLAFNRLITDELPIRITHNDTKFNNILFDEAGKAVCVIDLDTVMPGSPLHDFGDAIRTAANTAAEDEPDPGRVEFSMDIFKAITRGYLSLAREVLTPEERENLAFSSIFMTYIIGLRFLTDYLSGDTYYHTDYPAHNLVRARVQFRLVKRMEERLPEMRIIVRDICDMHTSGQEGRDPKMQNSKSI